MRPSEAPISVECPGCGAVRIVQKRHQQRHAGARCRPCAANARKPRVLSSLRERFDARCGAAGDDDCWNWTGMIDAKGYAIIWDGKKTLRANRVSYALHVGEPPPDLLVCHHCDNPSCVNPSHLFLGTAADNNADRDAKGRHGHGPLPAGEKHPAAKLTNADVRDIRAALASGGSWRRTAKRFGVSKKTIGDIKMGRRWAHVGDP